MSVITKVSHLYDKKIPANALKMQIMTVWLGAETVRAIMATLILIPIVARTQTSQILSLSLSGANTRITSDLSRIRGIQSHKADCLSQGELFKVLIPWLSQSELLTPLCLISDWPHWSQLHINTKLTKSQPKTSKVGNIFRDIETIAHTFKAPISIDAKKTPCLFY